MQGMNENETFGSIIGGLVVGFLIVCGGFFLFGFLGAINQPRTVVTGVMIAGIAITSLVVSIMTRYYFRHGKKKSAAAVVVGALAPILLFCGCIMAIFNASR